MSLALDPDLVVKLLRQLGGYNKVHRHLADEGLVNPRTSKPFSKAFVIWVAKKSKDFPAWRASVAREHERTQAKFAKVAKKALEK